MKAKESAKNKILSILLNKNVPTTVAELALEINKTGRTVRNYLDELEKELSNFNVKLIRKTSKGIYLEGDPKDISKLKSHYNKSIDEYESYSSKYRQMYILKILLENKYSYTIQLFAEELYCSKGTIVNDLVYVQKYLEDRNLVLKRRQNQGLWIEGKEKDYRNALSELLKNTDENENTKKYTNNDIDSLDYRIDFVNYKKIKDLFPHVDIIFIQKIVQNAEHKLGFYFTDQAFINLIVHIIITIERVKNKKTVKMKKDLLENLKSKSEYSVAEYVSHELEEKFKIDFSEEETAYICIHMLGSKVQQNNQNKNIDILEQSCDEQTIRITRNIMSVSSDILGVDLTKDDNLFSSLLLHLRPTIVRLKYGLKLNNPMLNTIKKDYTNIFGAAWACSSIFEKELGISVNDDEIGYIALHLALAYEKSKHKIKTIVVCSSGIGTSQLIALKLQDKFKQLDIVNVLPLNCITETIIEDVDLIISTITNFRPLKKAIYVSVLLDDRDIANIKRAIMKLNYNKEYEFIATNENCTEKDNCNVNLSDEYIVDNKYILDPEFIYLDDEHTDYEKALNYYAGLMEKKGIGKKGFKKDIIEREKIGSTYIGKGIAIPHAKDKFINVCKICLVRFKKPIYWHNNEIKILIILCIKFDDIYTTKKFFKNFYSVLSNEDLLKNVMKSEDKNIIIESFIGGGNSNG
ncbi:BglG family transcription antiterminator [Clostridium sp.]|uniref:BglG family transcription antiterminator n=1 Tax=Clostridium sp. TaxID=1506 RepID=UPI003A5C0EA6